MNLSRKWLDEFVTVHADDKEFDEAMTLSGSKVETTRTWGRRSTTWWWARSSPWSATPTATTCGSARWTRARASRLQIVTGAWNVHPGDMVPVALHKSTLPGGKKIERGKLRGVLSNGMLCGMSELGLDERDFPYAAITPPPS